VGAEAGAPAASTGDERPGAGDAPPQGEQPAEAAAGEPSPQAGAAQAAPAPGAQQDGPPTGAEPPSEDAGTATAGSAVP
jgi:hypothetical protein